MLTPPEKDPPKFDGVRCPKCQQPVVMGYGLMGGGIGPYWVCDTDGCDFFYKKQDSGDVHTPTP